MWTDNDVFYGTGEEGKDKEQAIIDKQSQRDETG
jgi:hypothetical protein